VEAPDAAKKPKTIWQILGPGIVTGASDDDPSGIGTYSQAGAQFGFGMLWTLLFTFPLMCAIQEISARIGRTTGHGIAGNLRRHFPKWVSYPVIVLVFVANTLNIGADLGAMGQSLRLLIGGPPLVYVLLFAIACFGLPAMLSYKKYEGILRWLTVVLFAYVIAAFTVHVPWSGALRSTVVPSLKLDVSYLAILVAVLGTTISPYLFIWQASEEAEGVKNSKGEKALIRSPEEAPVQLRRIRIDTYIGMLFSNSVAWFIMLASAVTLFATGHHQISSAQDAAEALRPIAGHFAFLLFTVGIIGTGLLAVPVLAGSAAYALGEQMRRRVGIDFSPKRAPAFYVIFGTATFLGASINFSSINPIRALVWSAIINGVVAVPVMVAMMLMVRNPKVMGDIAHQGKWLHRFGWLATFVMAVAVLAMFATS
jgi:NRAMP (natural resistance-associated macrophage protein)-like metal ion transporter